MKMKAQLIRTYGTQQGSAKEKVYSHECINYKTERSQIKNLMLHLKLLEK
jgi:hypothetical protein